MYIFCSIFLKIDPGPAAAGLQSCSSGWGRAAGGGGINGGGRSGWGLWIINRRVGICEYSG